MAAMVELSFSKRKVLECILGGVLGLIASIPIFYLTVLGRRDILSNPILSIHDLYVPALNKTTSFNTSIFIDLEFERWEAYSSPDYGEFQMTLFYGKNRDLLVANHVVEGFNLGQSLEFHVKAAMEAPRLPWEEASRAVSEGSEVWFMVELVVIRRPESCAFFTDYCSGRPEVRAASVAVDASGHKVSKNAIAFKHIGVLDY